MFLKFQQLNYLLIFIVLLISFIGAAGLYSAAGGSYSPWASRHLIRVFFLLSLAIVIAFIDIKLKRNLVEDTVKKNLNLTQQM